MDVDLRPVPNDDAVTRARIIDLLRDNTGRALCDSGGAYGRHWERNQDRDFENDPEGTLGVYTYADGEHTPEWSVSLYHWLAKFLYTSEHSQKLQQMFDAFAEDEDNQDEPWEDVLDKFKKGLGEDMPKFEYFEFTYEDTNVSLDQSAYIWWFDDDLVIIRTHNGCDLRGGYSKPGFFTCSREDMSSNIVLYCPQEGCGVYVDVCYDDLTNQDEQPVESVWAEFETDGETVVCKKCKTPIMVGL